MLLKKKKMLRKEKMGVKKRWSELGEEIKTTLKHEFGRVNINHVNLGSEFFSEDENSSVTVNDWQEQLELSPELTELPLEIIPPIESVGLKSQLNTVSLIADVGPLLITHLILEEDKPLTSMPALSLEAQPVTVECFFSTAILTADLSISLAAEIASVPCLPKARTFYNQRLILKMPLKREPLNFERFSRDEIYLFWSKLMTQHRVTLAEAELWAVFSRVPLNLLAKVWIEADRTLKMFLHQQTLKPKMVYLIVGRLKKNQQLIQAALNPAELAKLH